MRVPGKNNTGDHREEMAEDQCPRAGMCKALVLSDYTRGLVKNFDLGVRPASAAAENSILYPDTENSAGKQVSMAWRFPCSSLPG